ncbi:MAG: helix-turn-helix transcriptional regulator [Candidatus Riflebacteria bacterium]|nr:helix-turn-helix transcriptional regulator [Candidatus Riflebacteria bacterium]
MDSELSYLLRTPKDIILETAKRIKSLRLEQNITQDELASRIGVSTGTIKRFEKTGEIQFHALAKIALVLGRLDDFDELFKISDTPISLYNLKEPKQRQRARK